uniref:Uncharacterized protein n=1 Tax=Anguilla anguilla TaxID=7936 RepID=A0A0E9UYV1_ANGAN
MMLIHVLRLNGFSMASACQSRTSTHPLTEQIIG